MQLWGHFKCLSMYSICEQFLLFLWRHIVYYYNSVLLHCHSLSVYTEAPTYGVGAHGMNTLINTRVPTAILCSVKWSVDEKSLKHRGTYDTTKSSWLNVHLVRLFCQRYSSIWICLSYQVWSAWWICGAGKPGPCCYDIHLQTVLERQLCPRIGSGCPGSDDEPSTTRGFLIPSV